MKIAVVNNLCGWEFLVVVPGEVEAEATREEDLERKDVRVATEAVP